MNIYLSIFVWFYHIFTGSLTLLTVSWIIDNAAKFKLPVSALNPKDKQNVEFALSLVNDTVIATLREINQPGSLALAEYLQHALNIYDAFDVKLTVDSDANRNSSKRKHAYSLTDRLKLLSEVGTYFKQQVSQCPIRSSRK